MGLFDVAGINPDEIEVSTSHKPGNHPFTVTGVDIKNSKAGDPYVIFSYDIDEDWPLQDWFRILPEGKTIAQCDDTDDSFNTYSYRNNKGEMVNVRQTEKTFFENAYKQLKRRLMDLGVPEDKVNSINPMDLKGVQGMVTTAIKPNSDFPSIKKVWIPAASGTALPSAGAMPTAPTMPSATSIPSAPSVPTQPPAAVPAVASTDTPPAFNPFK